MKVPETTPLVTYAGVTLGGATLYDWPYTSGTAPVERGFVVSRTRAEDLRKVLGKPGTLKIVGPRKTLEVEQIYLLEILPGDDPNTLRIRLSDRRWLWPKTWVATTFNARRMTGDKFLRGEGRLENRLIQPEILYARYSLRVEGDDPAAEGSVPWTAKTAAQWVVEKQLRTPVAWKNAPVEVELQDVTTDDQGPGAIERVLAYLPGFDLYIDETGTCVFYDRYSGDERQVLAGLPPPQRDGPWFEIVDRRAIRPKSVVVLFTPEPEIRLDHFEPTDGATVARTEDEPALYQVGKIPDVTLTIDGVELARSSWADLQKMFTAWGAFGVLNREVSFTELRRHALKYGWAQFEQAWGNNPLLPPDSVNHARARAAAEHWRRTFRIDRFWAQRLAGIRAYRAGIVDPDTGAYAPASVFSDWIRRPSYKGFARSADQNQNQGWAVRGWSALLGTAEPAPARVRVLDEQAMILSIEPQVDPYGLSQAMLLGYPVDGQLPSQILGDANRTGQELYARWDRIVLESGWCMSVVLTVVPGSPNTSARFYPVEVKANEIKPDPGTSEGPTVYARVFPGVLTARFAWSDDAGDAIKAAIKGLGPYPAEQLVNGDQVRDVALATAARVYDTLRDRPLGGATVDMDPGLKPAGTISGVRHVMQDGETTSSLSFGVVTQPADIWRYLNASTRRVILRINHQFSGGG